VNELPIIQRTYDLIRWYVPILNRLPRDQKLHSRFPLKDLLPGKLRPALLLAPLPSGRQIWLVCMISSQLAQAVAGVDEIIKTIAADFAETGLKSGSVIK